MCCVVAPPVLLGHVILTIIFIISSWWSGLLYLFSLPLWTLQYARQHLLGFMFRHGHYTDACMLFFPQNAVPPPPQPSAMGVATSSTSPQRLDPLATDYGNIDDLCDLCIGYGAMNVLEEVISTRIACAKQQDVNQHTAAVLARICTYCETHRHFNYLYQFQVNGTPFSLSTFFFLFQDKRNFLGIRLYLEGMIFYHSYLSSIWNMFYSFYSTLLSNYLVG